MMQQERPGLPLKFSVYSSPYLLSAPNSEKCIALNFFAPDFITNSVYTTKVSD
jgi:hypothetical protein